MSERGRRKVREGVVISGKMDKTLVVQIERQVKHPIYKRFVRRRRKFHVHYDAAALGHSPEEACREGDIALRNAKETSHVYRCVLTPEESMANLAHEAAQ